MPITIIKDSANELVKMRQEYLDDLDGMNKVGEINYEQYSELFDMIVECSDKAYNLGKEAKE